MNNLTKEKLNNLIQQVTYAKEQWIYDCLQTLLGGIPFDKAKLKELITYNDLTLITRTSDVIFTQEFLSYSSDYVANKYLKYIAEFKVTKEESIDIANVIYKIQYTLPKFNNIGQVLKTKLTFKNNNF